MPIKRFQVEGVDNIIEADVPADFANNPELAEQWFDEVYYPYYDSGLATAAEDPSHPFSGLPDWAARGFYRLGQAANATQVQLGLDNPENAAKDIQDYEKHLDKVPQDPEVIDTLIKFQKANENPDAWGGLKEFWDAASTPAGVETILTVTGESFAQFAPALAATIATGVASGGMAYPALAIGAVQGLGSLAVEYGSTSLEAMEEHLNKEGKSISDNKAVAELLSNKQKMEDFSDFALKRGIPIAVIDGLSMGLAGKLLLAVKSMSNSSKAARYAAFGTEALAIQPASGALGEFAAQKVAGQDLKIADIALEAVAEVPGGIAEINLGLLVDAKRTQQEKKIKEQLKNLQEQKAEDLRQATRMDEFNIVTDDLVTKTMNPETGIADSVAYEERIIKYSGLRPKAGERSVDKSGIKNIFNLKNPKSVNTVLRHLQDEKFIEKGKGGSGFRWTKKAEQKYDEIVPVEIGDTVQWTSGDIDQFIIPKTVSDIRDTDQGKFVFFEDSSEAGVPYEEVNRLVLTPEQLAERQVVQDKADAKREEIRVATEETERTDTLKEQGDVVSEQETLKQQVNNQRTQSQELEAQKNELDTQLRDTELSLASSLSQEVSPTDPLAVINEQENLKKQVTDARNKSQELDAQRDALDMQLINSELSLASSLNPARPVRKQIPLPEEATSDFITNVPSTFVDFTEEATVNDPPPVKEKLKEFKLRREGREIPVLNPEKTNIEEIKFQQQLSIDASPADAFNSMGQMNKANEQYKDVTEVINTYIIDMQNATNNEEREERVRRLKERVDKMNIPQLVSGPMMHAYKVYHPQRLGEIFKALKPTSYFNLLRREFRELFQQIPFSMILDFQDNTSIESKKDIGIAYVFLDAFFGPRKTHLLNEDSIIVDSEGNISFTIPDSPPNIVNEETGDMSPSVDQELYELQLKEMGGFKPGDEIKLQAEDWVKLQEVNSALRVSYATYIRSFARFLLQKQPLAKGIESNINDTPDSLQRKVIESMLINFATVNNFTREQAEEVRKRFTRSDKNVIEFLIKFREENFEKNSDSYNLMNRIISHAQIVKIINEYNRTLKEHPFYIPRIRYGDYIFSVYDTDTKETVAVYVSESRAGDTFFGDKQQKKRLEKIRQQKLKNFRSSRFKVGTVNKRTTSDIKNELELRDITLLDRLLMGMAHNNNVERKTFIKQLLKEAEDEVVTKGFGARMAQRSPKLILGYYNPEEAGNYIINQASNYIRSSADSASNLEFYNPIERVLDILKNGVPATGPDDPTYIEPQTELYKLAQKTVDSINSPNEPGSLFKSIAFHYALGGNFSSAFVNLTQTFVTSIPMLNTIVGLRGGSATKEVMRGLSDARKLFKFSGDRVSSYGFKFDQNKKPTDYDFLTDDEYTFLKNLYDQGVIQAIVNLDLGAKYQQQLGEVVGTGRLGADFSNNLARLMDASAFMFGAVEQINRIATALAAYRLAVKSEKNLKNFEKYAQFTVFADQKMTPELAGKMTVYQTQFLIGKENRPELFRSGIMNVGTQFLSFVMQYTTMYFRALQMFKVEPRMAATMLGGLVLSMMFFGGAMGLPFMENLRQLLSKLSKGMKWKGGEFDLEYGIRQALIDSNLPGLSHPQIVEMLTRGVASQVLGMDISRRVTAGEIIPFSFMEGDLMAATGPFGSLMADVVLNMNQALDDGNYSRLITSVLPLGARYPIEGAIGTIFEKDITTSQGKPLIRGADISGGDRLKQAFGFTPGAVSDVRREKQLGKYLERKMRGPQDRYLAELARLYVERVEEKDINERGKITQEINDLRQEVMELNSIAYKNRKLEDVIKITPRALKDRIQIRLGGQVNNLRKNMSKKIRPIIEQRVNELAPK